MYILDVQILLPRNAIWSVQCTLESTLELTAGVWIPRAGSSLASHIFRGKMGWVNYNRIFLFLTDVHELFVQSSVPLNMFLLAMAIFSWIFYHINMFLKGSPWMIRQAIRLPRILTASVLWVQFFNLHEALQRVRKNIVNFWNEWHLELFSYDLLTSTGQSLMQCWCGFHQLPQCVLCQEWGGCDEPKHKNIKIDTKS